MKFQKITLWQWKQFDNVEIEFHPRLTVLTGANGSGKTTILNILARHFNWNSLELSTPQRDKQTGGFRFIVKLFRGAQVDDNKRGSLVYDNGIQSAIIIPDNNSAMYQLIIESQQPVPGLFVPSHRPAFRYAPINQIPTQKISSKQAHANTFSASQQWHNGGGGNPTNYHIKETLLSWVINGYGNEIIERDEQQVANFEGFQTILKLLLPKEIRFEKLTIRNSEIVMVTGNGEFLIEAVSGGITSIISLAWDIYTYSLEDSEGSVVVIDEVENHLHATLQRTILPNLTQAFPNVQFIVSTHSPLIVGSVKDSNVYALRFGDAGVMSTKLDLEKKAQSASEILKDVLGVPFTMPVWVEDQLNQITDKYSSTSFDKKTSQAMRDELTRVGLEELIPEAVVRVVDEKHDKAE